MAHAHPVRIEDGVPTEAARILYTEGDCWILAFELGEQLNAPLVAVGTEPFPDCWDHVLVDLGDDLLDVTGRVSRTEVERVWNVYPRRSPLVFTELGRCWSWSDYCDTLETPSDVDDRDVRTARRIALELIEQLGLTNSREKVDA